MLKAEQANVKGAMTVREAQDKMWVGREGEMVIHVVIIT